MAERGQDASMDRIRAYAREQVARTSLRKVATRAGVKVGATKKFVDGSEPYERNARLWRRWYAQEIQQRGTHDPGAVPAEDARVALEIVFTGLRPEERESAIPRAAAFVRDLYRALGYPPPPWADKLADRG
jgi:hypothetical protein